MVGFINGGPPAWRSFVLLAQLAPNSLDAEVEALPLIRATLGELVCTGGAFVQRGKSVRQAIQEVIQPFGELFRVWALSSGQREHLDEPCELYVSNEGEINSPPTEAM